MAMKATWCQVDGQGRDLRKDPVTDNGDKRSASGRLAVRRQDDGRLALMEKATEAEVVDSELVVVYRDGKVVARPLFSEIRDTLRRETDIYQNWGDKR